MVHALLQVAVAFTELCAHIVTMIVRQGLSLTFEGYLNEAAGKKFNPPITFTLQSKTSGASQMRAVYAPT